MPRATPDGMKVCSKCRKNKPVGEFGKHSKQEDGLRLDCKICSRLATRAWQQANPEKVKLQKKLNPGKKETIKNRKARWRHAHPELVKSAKKRSLAKLPDYYCLHCLRLSSAPPELIELKRLQVQIKRELKRQEQSK